MNNPSSNINSIPSSRGGENTQSQPMNNNAHLPAIASDIGIPLVDQRPARQSILQRMGQAFQSLRACGGHAVLYQVHTGIDTRATDADTDILATAVPPQPERLAFNAAGLSASALALSAVDLVRSGFAEEDELNARLVQLLSSESFQVGIDLILLRRAQIAHQADVPQHLTHLNLLTVEQQPSQSPNGSFIMRAVELRFLASFFPSDADPFAITHRVHLEDGLVFRVSFDGYDESENLTVRLHRASPTLSIMPASNFIVERGQEFERLSDLLRPQPAVQIGHIQYQTNGRNEGAIDRGGPLRECFTQAYEQALNVLTRDTPLQEGRKDINDDLDIAAVEARFVQLGDFGRLLAHVADQPLISLPAHLFEQSFEAILTLAKHSDILGIEGKNSVLALCQSATQALSNDKSILLELVTSLFPEMKTFLETDCNDPLTKYADSLEPTPDAAKSVLLEYLNDHLEKVLGLSYSSDTDTVTILNGSSRFLQLALIANGFNAVRDARIDDLNSIYPTEIKALTLSIRGSGDFRRALCDPDYDRAFILKDESGRIHPRALNAFKILIHQWASQANDQQLSAVCRAMTSSDVLPEHIGNDTNRLVIQIKNIPVIHPVSRETVGFAEISPHTCFGTLEIDPSIVQEILAEHRRNAQQIPPRLERLFGEELRRESRAFNAS